ncbi:MAG: hypothetical protein ACR2MP_16465 [Streptosporangiaceae bacterium]
MAASDASTVAEHTVVEHTAGTGPDSPAPAPRPRRPGRPRSGEADRAIIDAAL